MNTVSQTSKPDTAFAKLIALSLTLFYFPLFLNNYYFRDDWDRATREIANFRTLSRVFGGYFLHFFSGDYQNLTETSPLFQLLALLLVGVTIWSALKIRNIPFTPVTAVTVVAFAFNPFLIECLLYRYDCLTMCISYCSAIMAWAYFPKKQIIPAAFLILSLGTYQPFINLFILLAAAEFIYRLIDGDDIKPILITLLRCLVLTLIALLIYRFIVIHAYSVKTNRSDLIPLNSEGLDIVIKKIAFSAKLYFNFLSLTGIIIYFSFFILTLISIFHSLYHKKAQYKLVRFFVSIIIILSMTPLAYGPFLFIKDPTIGPRVLTQSIVLSAVLIYFAGTYIYPRVATWIFYLLTASYLICSLSFSYMAFNGLANQNRFDNFIISDIASTILKEYPNAHKVYVIGNLPHAPLVRGGVNRNQGLASIIIENPAWVSQLNLRAHGVKDVEFSWSDEAQKLVIEKLCITSTVPDIKSQYYAIYNFQKSVLIHIGEEKMCFPI